MSSHPASLRRTHTDLPAQPSSPFRHGSTASTSSSIYSNSTNSFAPSRTSTVSSTVSVGSTPSIGHKRGKSEVNTMVAEQTFGNKFDPSRGSTAGSTYENIRRSLRPLSQAPNASPPASKQATYSHSRSRTIDNPQYWKENRPQTPEYHNNHHTEVEFPKGKESQDVYAPPSSRLPHNDSPHTATLQMQLQTRPQHSHSLSTPQPPPLTTTLSAPDIETFQKSSTRHLRTLSKLAQSGETEEFAIDSPSVVGLQGRRRLKRADTVAGSNAGNIIRRKNVSTWAAGNWMDKQRQFLQAYEYLCHIGEAKEWIEEVIQKQIPPIVQLEEGLRDGVTLAEVVQAMYPNRPLRIFRHPRLQYRHSDNIALFFRLLDEVELPELFRFELIDLYEKKNIPKVIHCVHALSWLLFKKGLVDFRMGNLVGQLEFEHHELEQTQKGLDKAGVSMPSFTGMAANFGAEPEPEPEPEPGPESEEDRIERELHENEASIAEFQAQVKGAMLRLKLGNLMNDLWDFEGLLIDLQSRLRGDWARQVVQYRLNMRTFAVSLQAICRGFIVRSRQKGDIETYQAQEEKVLQFQTLIRASKARTQVSYLRSQMRKKESGVKEIQAAIRGALQRKVVSDLYYDTRDSGDQVRLLQAAIRGYLQRSQYLTQCDEMHAAEGAVRDLQSMIRGSFTRRQVSAQHAQIDDTKGQAEMLQAAIRGMLTRQSLSQVRHSLEQETLSFVTIQSAARARTIRKQQSELMEALVKDDENCKALQAMIRANAVRNQLGSLRESLADHAPSFTDLQSMVRAKVLRNQLESLREALAEHVPSFITIQSMARAGAVRSFLEGQRNSLKDKEESILELQSMIRGALLRRRLEADAEALQAEELIIADLQALARAAILRIEVGGILEQLDECDDEVSELQAHIRAMLVRVDVGQTLADLAAEEDVVADLQSHLRGYMVRSKFEEKRQYYRENMEKVVKAQSFVRGRIQGQAYKSLTSGKNPPVGTVKGFVHLLNDSEFDFDEEIEFEQMRKLVVQQVRQNELAEQYISQLDIKIALLVRNKITLDEVVKHQKHFGGHVGSLLPNREISKDPFDLKALNKTSRRKLEQYQVFFFLLQTQSQYLSKLFRRLREINTSEKEYDRIRHLMMGLFGYSQKRREEYYLIRLLARSAREEIESFNSLQDYLRCNSFWTKLFASYMKSPRDRKFMRDVLGPVVKENVIDNPDLDLESDPTQIYRSSINNEELRTGKRSRRPLNIEAKDAINIPEIRDTFVQHLQDLRDIADQFFTAFEEVLYRMPFGIRYIAKEMYECLLSRFAREDPGFILQTAGHWVWRNYFQPALIEPEKHGVVDRGMTQEQKRNLAEIARVIAQVASGRLFGDDENIFLQPLNGYISDSIQRLGQIWGDMISVQDAESYFDIDEFNDLYAKQKPTLYIKMSDIFSIHQLVASEIHSVCPSPDDILREVIRDLGSVKSNENELMSVNSSEISLTLNPKLAQVEDPEADVKSLFMETKRCVLYIIRVQSGANLMDIMVKPPTEEDEEKWMTLVRDELSANNTRRSAYSEANSLVDLASMSYSELKRTALENIIQLEHTGKIRRDNHYQDLLNAIAIDIRTKHRRRIQRERELESTRLTLARLNDQAGWLEQQFKTYNDYIEQAMVTLQNKKGKKRFLMPFTKQWDHQRELHKSGKVFKFGSYKYSARNLADKGVLVHWKGYTERQWDRVDLTISSNEVGVFTIDGSSGPMMVPGANAQVPLDDLLQAQFNNMQFLDFFDGQLRVNVNLFLHLIMRKFYNE